MPTLDEIRDFIQTIPTTVKSISYERLVELCNYYFPSLPYLTVDFTNEQFFFRQHEWSGWNVLYRGRKHEKKEDPPHPSISKISYIQKEDIDNIKGFGRANKQREAMFYGSLNIATASIETLSKGGEFLNSGDAMLTMGCWKFDAPLRLVEMPYSEKYWKLMYDSYNIQSTILTEEKIKATNQNIKAQFQDSLGYEILTLFGDAFANYDINSDSDYYLSNYYTDRVFNKIPGFAGDNIEGIIYPSVLNAYQESNIVLLPEVVDKKIKFMMAMQVWAVHFMKTSGGAQFIPIQDKIHADKDGKFLWK